MVVENKSKSVEINLTVKAQVIIIQYSLLFIINFITIREHLRKFGSHPVNLCPRVNSSFRGVLNLNLLVAQSQPSNSDLSVPSFLRIRCLYIHNPGFGDTHRY